MVQCEQLVGNQQFDMGCEGYEKVVVRRFVLKGREPELVFSISISLIICEKVFQL